MAQSLPSEKYKVQKIHKQKCKSHYESYKGYKGYTRSISPGRREAAAKYWRRAATLAPGRSGALYT